MTLKRYIIRVGPNWKTNKKSEQPLLGEIELFELLGNITKHLNPSLKITQQPPHQYVKQRDLIHTLVNFSPLQEIHFRKSYSCSGELCVTASCYLLHMVFIQSTDIHYF